MEDVFAEYPACRTKETADRMLYNGNALYENQLRPEEEPAGAGSCGRMPRGRIRVRDSRGRFCGLYEYSDEKQAYRPLKMFLPEV